MEDNTIFQPSASGDTQHTPIVPEQLVPVAQPVVEVVPQPVQPVSPPPPSQEDLSDKKNFSFPIKTILKGLLGLFVIVLVGFFLVRFIASKLPKKVEQVTLAYWGLWEDPNIVKGILDDFHRQNPNITVVYTKQDIKDYRERLSVRAQNGTGPDIFRFHNTWVPQLSDVLLPLPKEVISPVDFQNNYFLVAQNDLMKSGAIYGIPLEIDTLSLFVNTEILKNAGYAIPENWDEFVRVAKGLTVKDETGAIKTSGAAMGTFDNVNHASEIISMLMLQNGTNLRNISENAKAASDALLFYSSFGKPPENVWDSTLDQSLIAFAKGKAGMYFGYSWDIFVIKSLNPALPFEVKVVPHLFQRDITVASYWVEGVSQKSKHQKESLLFMKFLSQKDTAEKLYASEAKTRLFGELYARIDLAQTLKSNPLLAPFVEQAKSAQSSFFVTDTYDNGLNSRMNVYLGNAVRSILDNTSPESATDTLSQGVVQVLQQYQPQTGK